MSVVSDNQADYRAAFDYSGEKVTILRSGNTFGPIRARVLSFIGSDLVADIQQGDRKLLLLAEDVVSSGIPLPLQTSKDRIIWNGKTLVVQTIDDATRRVNGVLMAYEIKIVGA